MILEGSKDLVKEAKTAADRLRSLEKEIRCVSHYDCDGISSAVIVHMALSRENVPFRISFVDELDERKLETIAEKFDEEVFLFTDIGSGQIGSIEKVLDDREVIIADHHDPGEGEVSFHINPHRVGIDGGENISGAGVTYLLMRLLNEENQDLIKYALVGATGDIQKEGESYLGLNENLMEDAEERGLIERKKGLKLFGRKGRSIVKALKYTTEPYLPGITNNESGAVQFLSEIGIDPRENGDWRSLEDLSEEEEREIVHGLITKGYDVESLLGDIYLLDNGWEIGEFASLLNACGRLDRPEDGLKICLEDDPELAFKIKREYGREISKYMSYVENNLENSEVVKKFGNGAIIVGRDRINPNIVGTIATICLKSDVISRDVLVGMAHKEEDFTKISARARKNVIDNGLKMNDFMSEVCTVCEGSGGGHEAAAGGKIPREEEDRFIKMVREVLESEG